MIFFPELKAIAKCEAPDCAAETQASVVLGAGGRLGVGAEGWQWVPLENGAIHSFCPAHPQTIAERDPPRIQVGPRGVRPMNGHGRGG